MNFINELFNKYTLIHFYHVSENSLEMVVVTKREFTQYDKTFNKLLIVIKV